jgi:integrase
LGKTSIDAIDSAAVRDVLAPIWLEIPDTARRILQRISSVLDFAHVKGWRKEETSLRSVRKGLPRQAHRNRHYKAMPYSETPSFVQDVAAEGATAGRDAMLFTIYTAARSGETRYSTWSEFDLDNGVWSIPAERMKAGEAHLVPLSEPVLAILRRRWKARASDDAFVFSANGEKPISDMTITKVLRNAGIPDYTVHGFRSTFTDWAAEKTNFPKEVADKALAHKIPNQVEAAYRRTDFFEKRRKLMNRWAIFLESKPARQRRPKADTAFHAAT